MSLIDYLNIFFQVIRSYVNFLFNLVIAPGVSIGSILLVSLLLFVIAINVWPRS